MLRSMFFALYFVLVLVPCTPLSHHVALNPPVVTSAMARVKDKPARKRASKAKGSKGSTTATTQEQLADAAEKIAADGGQLRASVDRAVMRWNEIADTFTSLASTVYEDAALAALIISNTGVLGFKSANMMFVSWGWIGANGSGARAIPAKMMALYAQAESRRLGTLKSEGANGDGSTLPAFDLLSKIKAGEIGYSALITLVRAPLADLEKRFAPVIGSDGEPVIRTKNQARPFADRFVDAVDRLGKMIGSKPLDLGDAKVQGALAKLSRLVVRVSAGVNDDDPKVTDLLSKLRSSLDGTVDRIIAGSIPAAPVNGKATKAAAAQRAI